MGKNRLLASVALFGGALLLAWVTHGTGVVQNDPTKHVSIPKTLTVPLQVQAAFNGTDVFFRYRWPSPNAGIHHDMLVFTNGAWAVKGNAEPGSQRDGLHEDRIAMMLDDGSVPEFGRYGGYIAIGGQLAGFADETDGKAVKDHPYLGKTLGQDEPTKYLPGTRKDMGQYGSTLPEADQKRLGGAGYFLDLWHWRAARSNPVGYADDQYVGPARLSDAGKSPYATNWDGEKKQPRLMFDPAKAGGIRAFTLDAVKTGKVPLDGVNALRDDVSIAFDPAAGWKEGDAIPRRILRAPDGSRADIAVAGIAAWSNGMWDVTLRRKMDTAKPMEDKIIRDGGVYQAAFAIHRQATGGRWHHVSLPMSVGFGRSADLEAERFEGDTPPWKAAPATVTLFYPGQVSWPHLNSSRHGGADSIRKGVPVKQRHSEEQLAHYGIEAEFADAIRNQWYLTILAGLALIFAFGFAINRHLKAGGAE